MKQNLPDTHHPDSRGRVLKPTLPSTHIFTREKSGSRGDFFCGTNRIFIRVYRVTDPGTPVENLGELAGSTGVLQG
jgi:hypothetical protein